MIASRRRFLVASLAAPVAVGPLGRALAQSMANVDRNGAAYIGELLVYDTVSSNATTKLEALISGIDAGWTDLTWENDMIGVGAVLNAIYAVAQKIESPDQFKGSRAEYLHSLEDRSKFGTAARAAIETGNPQALLDATADLRSGLDHYKKSTDLLNQELAG